MSTTVSYKGATIATVSNNTKTLLTEGKYLEDDLTLTDVSGGGSTLITKNISANGTYNASSDSADGYSQVTVAVPASAVDTGTKNITANGNNQDVVGYAAVNVNVPNSYSAGDEGKVVSNGALVAQTSDTVTTNDTYDTTLINSLTVNVSGGGGTDTLGEMLGNTLTSYTNNTVTNMPSYAFANVTSLQSIELGAVSSLKTFAFQYCSNLISAKFASVTELANMCLDGCSKLPSIVLPKFNHSNTATLRGCSLLKSVDLGNSNSASSGAYIGQQVFQNDTILDTIVLRFPFAITLQNINSFNSTPFASGGSGGTIYVPSSLISSYQSASNWSTLLGYTNNQIKSIESTHTDPTAPIDLTIYYADGTPISS